VTKRASSPRTYEEDGAMKDIMGVMKQVQAMQSKMQDLQAELERTEVTGSAGGGLVSVRLTAKGERGGSSRRSPQ
jgi:DNA-binding protein YbaB